MRFIKILFVVIMGLPLAPGFAQESPNIILIMADDLGYETLGCNGGTSYKTPNLDKLAEGGIRFTNAFSMPLCTPSRVQLMTGKYNFRNYVKFEYLDTREKTFGNFLRDANYETCIAGKWQLGGDTTTPKHFGFDNYCLWQLDRKGYFTRYRNPVIVQDGSLLEVDENAYGEDVFVDYIKAFIKRSKEKPFFVYYPMTLPHAPFQPVPGHPDYGKVDLKIDESKYFKSMVEYLDAKIGDLVSFLKKEEQFENTVIIFLGDNGTDTRITSQQNDTSITGNKGFGTLYGTHVPMIVSWPAKVEAGGVSNALVDFSDFLPTLMELGNSKLPKRHLTDGISFYSTLVNGKGTEREVILCDYDAKGRDFPTFRYTQDATFKYYDDGRIFNFIVDPLEKNPLTFTGLSLSDQKAVSSLKDALQKYKRAQQSLSN